MENIMSQASFPSVQKHVGWEERWFIRFVKTWLSSCSEPASQMAAPGCHQPMDLVPGWTMPIDGTVPWRASVQENSGTVARSWAPSAPWAGTETVMWWLLLSRTLGFFLQQGQRTAKCLCLCQAQGGGCGRGSLSGAPRAGFCRILSREAD